MQKYQAMIDYMLETVKSKQFSRYIKARPELCNWVMNFTKQFDPINLNESVWIIKNGNPPTCMNGKKSLFNSFEKGFWSSCGNKSCGCKKQGQAIKLKLWHQTLSDDEKQILVSNAKKTFVDKYGVENPMQSSTIKEKRRKTSLAKYGVESPIKSNEVREKITKTVQEKYGVNTPFESQSIREKSLKTTKDRYGNYMTHARKASYEKFDGKNPFTNDDIKAKAKKTMIEKYVVEHALQNPKILSSLIEKNLKKFNRPNINQTNISDQVWEILKDKEKFAEFVKNKTSATIARELNLRDSDRALAWLRRHECLDHAVFRPNSAMEEDFAVWLNDLGVKYQRRNRSILPNGLELDFVFPDHNFAVELNGLFHHSEIGGGKNKTYHYQKFKMCQSQKIQLLQFWQDEYWQKLNIVKSKVLYLLGMQPRLVHARKCQINVLENLQLEKTFMNINHIQGYAEYRQHSVGSFFNQELVGVMSFSVQKGHWELIRYATSVKGVAPGLFSKMLGHSIKILGISGKLISFSDNRISLGQLYQQTGFDFAYEIGPGYAYTKNYSTRENRQNFMKNKIIKKFNLEPQESTGKTEWELAQQVGYDRIWDAGKIKWIKAI